MQETKKYFVIADVHGFFNELQRALDEAGFDIKNKNHILISCGDLFDRGKKNKECLEFVMSLPKKRRILIRGNHEDLLEDLLKGDRYIEDYDKHNGTLATIEQLSGGKKRYNALAVVREDPLLRKYFNSLVDYYADDKYIFCHGYVPYDFEYDPLEYEPKERIVFDLNASEGRWRSARWDNGMYQWHVIKLFHEQNQAEIVDKRTVVCGHWHVSYGHTKFHGVGKEFPSERANWKKECCFDIFKDEGIIALDACTALTHKVNVLVLEGA